MREYLTVDSPEAFVDFPPIPEQADPYIAAMGPTVICPKCKGHGGWNLVLNAYPLRDQPDTAANRHRYAHFRANCNNCNGWGYVLANSRDATCLHEYGFSENVGNCLNTYECSKCGKRQTVDSSD